MAKINYDNRRFLMLSSSSGAPAETIFYYFQRDDVVWGHFEGGVVRYGNLIAKVDAEGVLDLRYQYINTDGDICTGTSLSTPEVLPDGRIRLHEEFQWTSGDYSHGQSMVEEIKE
ncbi:MAG: n-acetylglutamate synthase [Anaerolineae bacterium]|nr:n-acetylglutamate synthase [Anaerolineae bacterium]